MRFTTFRQSNEDRLGLVVGQEVIDLHKAQPQISSDLRTALRAGQDLIGAAQAALASPQGRAQV